MGAGDFSSAAVAVVAVAVLVSASSVSDSELLELETTVAASVGLATCSMKSRKLGVNLMSSGRDSMTADKESTPLFTGGISVL